MQNLKREPIEEMEEEIDAGSLVDSVSLDDVTSMEPRNTCDVIVTNVSQCSEPGQQKSIISNLSSIGLVFFSSNRPANSLGFACSLKID